MGYMTELNTLCRLPKGFPVSTLAVGQKFQIERERERTFPLHIALLLVDNDWTFYGYCVVHDAFIKDNKTTLTIEILSLFSQDEQSLYKEKFLEAAKKTGELQK